MDTKEMKDPLLVPFNGDDNLLVADAGKRTIGRGAHLYVGTGTGDSDPRPALPFFCHGVLVVDGRAYLRGDLAMPIALVNFLTDAWDTEHHLRRLPQRLARRVYQRPMALSPEIRVSGEEEIKDLGDEDLEEWLEVQDDSE